MMARIAANICMGLAGLIYLFGMPFFAASCKTYRDPNGGDPFLLFAQFPLWFLLIIAFCAGTAKGGLDWLLMPRGGQYAVALAAGVAMAVVATMSAAFHYYPEDRIPWAIRPFVPSAWAMWVFPGVVLCFCLFTVNPDLGSFLPRVALRATVAAVGGVSLLVAAGLLCEHIVSSQQRMRASMEKEESQRREEVQRAMAELQALDVANNLGVASRYLYDPALSKVAIEKIHAVPDLEQRLAAGLRSDWSYEILLLLDTTDPPDKKALAEPVRDALSRVADLVLKYMRGGDYLHPYSFRSEASVALSVADKYSGLGVDLSPPIRAFRSALNEPHSTSGGYQQEIKFDCAADLDSWLARNAPRR
jgi:hypothetical protein